MMSAATHPFDLYERIGVIAFSLGIESETKDGSLKKKLRHRGGWQKIEKTDIRPTDNAVALLTGERSGITVIDVDDPTLPHNIKLMELMGDCNMIAKTRKGFHYVFKYDERIKQTQDDDYALDTRNNGGCILCEPTHLEVGGKVVATYEWTVFPMDGEELATIPEDAVEYLFSVDSKYRVQKVEEPKKETVENVSVESEPKEIPMADKDQDALTQILNGLAQKRWDNYDDWLRIGMVCKNEGVALSVWDSLSKKSSKYKAGSCAEKWASFGHTTGPKLSQATLWKWLKEDNPTVFYSLMEPRTEFFSLMESLNHNDIARYFYNNNPDTYLYNKVLGWYLLSSSNVWEHTEKHTPPFLKRHIADTLQEATNDAKKIELSRYTKEIKAIPLGDEHKQARANCIEKHKSRMKMIFNSYKTFGSSDFCNGVMSFLPSYYSKEDLEEVMDKNGYLFAFSDGVYDLKTGAFRAIQPTDYISLTTGYEYPKKSNPVARAELNDIFYRMFENEESPMYLKQILASCLFGGNRWERFYVLTGKGRNGKGVTSTLLERAFGKYYHSVDVSLFTKPSEGNDRPITPLVDARSKRIMMTLEAESDERLQAGLLKKISGRDLVEARTQNSKHIYRYLPPYKVFIQTNNIPKLNRVDDAVQKRMEILFFPLQFVAEPTEPQHRQADPDVKEIKCKSNEWRDEFILMLTEIYQTIKDLKSLKAPESVSATTSEYFDDNNPLKIWLEQFYDITNNDGDVIKSSELKAQYLVDTHTEKMADTSFKQLMDFNHITHKKTKHGNVYVGLKRKNVFIGVE